MNLAAVTGTRTQKPEPGTRTDRFLLRRPDARCAVALERLLPVLPSLPGNAGEHAEPQLVVERSPSVAAHVRCTQCGRVAGRRTAQIARHAAHARRVREIVARSVVRLRIEPLLLIEQGAGDAAPVEPAAEMRPLQTLRRDDVLHRHLRHVEAAQPLRAGPEAPLAHLLCEERARPAPDALIPASRDVEGPAPESPVHVERHPPVEFDRLWAAVEQRDPQYPPP